MSSKLDFFKKISSIQFNLNAKKSQVNTFGNYNYRSTEDILEGLKPLLAESSLFQFITDDVVRVGDRFYIKSTVTVTDGENEISNSSFAREPLSKKGMDDAQITGSTSSYARKYALNGMWLIDDCKDADTNEMRNEQTQKARKIASGFDPDKALGDATAEVFECQNEAQIKEVLKKNHSKFNNFKDHQQKLVECCSMKKQDLEESK